MLHVPSKERVTVSPEEKAARRSGPAQVSEYVFWLAIADNIVALTEVTLAVMGERGGIGLTCAMVVGLPVDTEAAKVPPHSLTGNVGYTEHSPPSATSPASPA